MTDLPWLRHYPAGVEPSIGEIAYRNLPALLSESAEQHADQVAFRQVMPNGMNGALRYRDVERLSDDFALYLREVAGLEQGDRVAVQMPNCLSYPVIAFGVLKAGCVLVNTNPLYTATEMIHRTSRRSRRSTACCDPPGRVTVRSCGSLSAAAFVPGSARPCRSLASTPRCSVAPGPVDREDPTAKHGRQQATVCASRPCPWR